MTKPMRRMGTIGAGLLAAAFVPLGPAAHAACNPGHIGLDASCPEYTAPATTAVPGASMDGSTAAVGPISMTLFNGVVPPNGFMVQIIQPNSIGQYCNINDNGPASIEPPPAGFLIGGVWVNTPLPNNLFITPPGYKPMGPVSISCTGSIYIEARAW
jgi:hypothetical protein